MQVTVVRIAGKGLVSSCFPLGQKNPDPSVRRHQSNFRDEQCTTILKKDFGPSLFAGKILCVLKIATSHSKDGVILHKLELV